MRTDERKHFSQLVLSGVEGQIAHEDIEFFAHY